MLHVRFATDSGKYIKFSGLRVVDFVNRVDDVNDSYPRSCDRKFRSSTRAHPCIDYAHCCFLANDPRFNFSGRIPRLGQEYKECIARHCCQLF